MPSSALILTDLFHPGRSAGEAAMTHRAILASSRCCRDRRVALPVSSRWRCWRAYARQARPGPAQGTDRDGGGHRVAGSSPSRAWSTASGYRPPLPGVERVAGRMGAGKRSGTGGLVVSTEVLSASTRYFAPLRLRTEKTYSAPFRVDAVPARWNRRRRPGARLPARLAHGAVPPAAPTRSRRGRATPRRG